MTREELERIKLNCHIRVLRIADVVSLCDALEEAWKGGCKHAGPGRGDCEHAVGLPGYPIAMQHDGYDTTVDVYGKPNGWCWSCWKSYQREEAIAVKNNLCQQNTELLEDVSALTIERDKAIMEGMALAKEKDGMQVEIDRLRADIDAYRGSLGYAVPGDHDGRLSDGTYPVNGIAEANRQEIAALTAKVRAVEWEAC